MALLGLFLLVAAAFEAGASKDKVSLVVYYESMCPDSELFFQKQLLPTYTKMAEYLKIELVPYGNAHYSGQRDRYTFRCQHGHEECYGNMVQTCFIELVNNTESQIKFVNCAFKSPSQRKSIDRCIEKKDLRRQVKNCVDGTLGPNLEYEMAKKTESLQPPHSFIPWITVNGEGCTETNDQANADLMSLVCKELKETLPDACSKSFLKKFRNYL